MAKKTTRKASPKRPVYTVDRALWGTAREVTALDRLSRLRDKETGLMCCLGHICMQTGVSKLAITDKDMPWQVKTYARKLVKIGLLASASWPATDSSLSEAAAEINDLGSISEAAREARLKKLFKEYGITLKFKGVRMSKAALKALKARIDAKYTAETMPWSDHLTIGTA